MIPPPPSPMIRPRSRGHHLSPSTCFHHSPVIHQSNFLLILLTRKPMALCWKNQMKAIQLFLRTLGKLRRQTYRRRKGLFIPLLRKSRGKIHQRMEKERRAGGFLYAIVNAVQGKKPTEFASDSSDDREAEENGICLQEIYNRSRPRFRRSEREMSIISRGNVYNPFTGNLDLPGIHCGSSLSFPRFGLSAEIVFDQTLFRLVIHHIIYVLNEWWSFELLVLLSGLLPNPRLETSVLSICFTGIAMIYNIPYGLGCAASTCMSNELGAGNPEGAHLAFRVVISVTIMEALVVSVTIFGLHRVIGYAYSSEDVVSWNSIVGAFLRTRDIQDAPRNCSMKCIIGIL